MRSLFVALLMIPAVGYCPLNTQEITREDAHHLVLGVLESRGFDVKSSELDVEDDADSANFPGFFLFTAYVDSPNLLLGIGGYAVSRKTADIWDWSNCVKFKTRTVRALQKRLRRKMNLSTEDYRRFDKERPFCLDP